MKNELRVMSYNIHSSGVGKARQLIEDVVNAILYADSDIVAIQEIERGSTNNGYYDQCEVIKEKADMDYCFTSLIERNRGSYGIAIFIKPHIEIQHWQAVPLPGLNNNEPRAMLLAKCIINDKCFTIVNTHLSFIRKEQRLQSEFIYHELKRYSEKNEHIILAGDFNAIPQGKTLTMLGSLLKRCKSKNFSATFPSFLPVLSIDHILISEEFTHKSSRVLRTPLYKRASDHLPLITDISF